MSAPMTMPLLSLARWLLIFSVIVASPLAHADSLQDVLDTEGEPYRDLAGAPIVTAQNILLMTYSTRGERLATVEQDGRTCVWKVTEHRPVRCLPVSQAGKPTAIAFDSSGEWLARGFSEGSVDVLGAEGLRTKEPCRQMALDEKLAIGRTITAIWFGEEPKGKVPKKEDAFRSIVTLGSKGGTLRRWSHVLSASSAACLAEQPVKAEELPPMKELPIGLFHLAAFHPSGEQVIIALDSFVGAWNVRTGERLWKHESPGGMITALALNRDGTQAAIGRFDGSLALVGMKDGQLRPLKSPHTGRIRALAFSEDRRTLAVGADDQQLTLWSLAEAGKSSYQPLMAPVSSTFSALQFQPMRGPRQILAGAVFERGVEFWEPDGKGGIAYAQESLRGNAVPIHAVAFSQNGSFFATGSDDRIVRIWKRRDDGRTWILHCQSRALAGVVRSLAFRPQPEDQLAVAADGEGIATFPVQNLSTDQCEYLTELPVAGSPGQDKTSRAVFRAVSYSGDGKLLAAGSEDHTIVVFDVEQKKQRYRLADPKQETVTALAFQPRAPNILAAGSEDRVVRLWNLTENQKAEPYRLEAQSASIAALSFSPDGSQLAVAAGKDLTLWNSVDHSLVSKRSPTGELRSAMFLPDAHRVAIIERAGDSIVWDAGSQKDELVGHPRAGLLKKDGELFSLAIDPKNHAVVSGGLGRVLFRTLEREMPTDVVLWASAADWASWAKEGDSGRLFRHETSGLLWDQDPKSGTINSVLPKVHEPDPNLTVELKIKEGEDPWEPGTAQVEISNKSGAGPALWIDMEEVRLSNELLWVQFATPPPRIMRLDAGVPITPKVRLAKGARLPLPWQTVQICVRARPSGGHGQNEDCEEVPIGPWWWRHLHHISGLLVALSGLFFVIRFVRRRRAPSDRAIVQTYRNENPLSGRRLDEYPLIDDALKKEEIRKRGFRSRALKLAGVPERIWQRALAAASTPAECANQLAECLLAHLVPVDIGSPGDPAVAMFRISLPPLALHVPDNAVLVVCASKTNPAYTALAQLSPSQLGLPRMVFVVDRTGIDTTVTSLREALASVHSGTVFVRLSDADICSILLSDRPEPAKDTLRAAIAAQCDVEIITPYRTDGVGITDEFPESFIGRQQELNLLSERYKQNFLLVGPRRMGKSSLLHAFRREMKRRHPEVLVLNYWFSSSSLAKIRAVDERLCADTPDAFYESVLKRASVHQLFLLDEADAFIEQESRSQFGFCHVMRALSGQGRASFVLTGYRQLHDAVRTPEHPLRNFGELLRLAPLDLDSAEKLIVEPLSAMRLTMEDPAQTVEWLQRETACRPHLLAYSCLALLRLRKPLGPPPLSLSEVQRAVYDCAAIRDDFGNWDAQTGQSLVDALVLRAAVILQRSSVGDLCAFLAKMGAPLSASDVEFSVNRLYDFHYALIVDAEGMISCPLPLFIHHLLGRQYADHTADVREIIEAQLTRDITAWRASSPGQGI